MSGEKIKAWVDGEFRELYDDELYKLAKGKKVLKTNGKSEYVYIDPPDRMSPEGVIQKFRRKNSNFTPPKKKRKKR